MELGRAVIKLQNINLLHEAIHPEHGLVWADGKAIYLVPLGLNQGQVENQRAVKLGEFVNGVQSVHWSNTVPEGHCFLCVIHEKNISIWKVDGSLPKLNFKQVRKVNIKPIPQGCVWNPGARDVLCILSAQQCSFYHQHLTEKTSHVLPQLESGRITCGDWLSDGSKLVVCYGTSVMVCSWPDIDNSVSNMAALIWTIPELPGVIKSVVPVSPNSALCAAELPLETLCKNQDAFDLSDLPNPKSGEYFENMSEGDIVRPRNHPASSSLDTLLSLPRNPKTLIEDASKLMYFSIEEKVGPQTVCSVQVRGIITPDILHYQASSKTVIVGSNSQSLLQVFYLADKKLTKVAEIQLDRQERPRGIGSLKSGLSQGMLGVLLVLGKMDVDPVLPSSSSSSETSLLLKFCSFSFDSNTFSMNNQHSSKMVNRTLSNDVTADECPKIPLRKKKSDRPMSTEIPKTLSGHFLMDYSSDSPEISPRSSGVEVRTRTVSSSDSRENTPEVPDTKLDISSPSSTSEKDSIVSKRNSGYIRQENLGINPATLDLQPSNHETRRTLSTEVFGHSLNTTLDKKKIVEIGPSSRNANFETEVVEFASQKPLFRNSDSGLFMSEEGVSGNKDVHEYIRKRFEERMKKDLAMGDILTADRSLEVKGGSRSLMDMKESKTEELDEIESELKKQETNITQLKVKMDMISRGLDKLSCVDMSRYQTMNKPEFIYLNCVYPDGQKKSKAFLLDNGRLQLEPIKKAFKLQNLEIIIDGEPFVTGCNIDGYIPMRFTSGTTLVVTGDVTPDSI
ncbi:hypothetical protein ACJMK2_027692 [Sinanodonta woodiana]|uniref:WD repeat and coiled-coil-containing protein n=1 Tax=Sinanodonta woodiana TaxID=1069815 RepID=A0ABD3X6A5_SINWO